VTTYTATVRGATATTTGTYSFRLLLTPPSEQFAIAFGDTVSEGVPAAGAGNVEVPGALDIYTFDGVAGQETIFDLLAGVNVFIGWRLVAPDGTELFDSFVGDRQVTLPATGAYTLTVGGNGIDDTGTYSFQLLDAATADEFTIGFGDTVSDGVPAPGAGNLEAPGAVDHYRFDAAAGQTVIVDALVGNTTVVRWSLSAPDGSTVFDAFFVDQEATLTETGTYTLTVEGLQITSTGTYSFQLLAAPPIVDEFTIAFGDVVSDGVPEPGAGNLEAPGAVDRYNFDATAGQLAIIDVLGGSTTDFAWRLTAPDGSTAFDALRPAHDRSMMFHSVADIRTDLTRGSVRIRA
jgi:predicted secreted protein